MSDLKNDIERYHKGELTPSEMHALEKKALSDPFLADALEGVGKINTDVFESDVRNLQMMIDHRVDQPQKTIPLWQWTLRIAAGLTLVAVFTVVILNVVKDNEPVQLAENKIKSESQSAEPKEQAPVLDSVVQSAPSLSMAKSKPKASQSVAGETPRVEKPNAVTESASIALQPVIANADIPQTEAKEDKIVQSTEAEEVQRIAQAESVPTQAARKEEAKEGIAKDARRKTAGNLDGFVNTNAGAAEKSIANNTRTVKGHISALEDGSALPGVNVVVKGTNTGAVTDEEGNYEITLTDNQAELVFSFIGYQSTELKVSESNQLDVQMSDDVSQLSEVVVTGYSMKGNEEEEDEDIPLELASPIGGRKAYKQYLEKNLRYPEVALENKIEGRVMIEFTVATTGALNNFKVLRSLGYGCDEEVIRLVKEGAAWTPSKYGKALVESNVKIKLRFSLPKK